MFAGLIVAAIAGIVALAVTALVRRHAGGLGLVAAPNARSSHTRPTPSGGGLGIVAGGTLGGLFAATQGRPEIALVLGLSLLVAALGVIDDRRPLPARVRLPVQIVLVGLLVSVVATPALGTTFGLDLPWPLLLAGATLAAVYWLNLFNFMDGIDGLAATEAMFVLVGAALLSALGPAARVDPYTWWALAIAAAAAGFLLLNWPPAKIFMGDAGSTWLGFTIAAVALATLADGRLSPWQWLILVALFLADASVTLTRRLWRREPIFSAHRLHAYQHLARRWGGHRPVTLLYGAVNVVLLLPLAAWVGLYPATIGR